MEHEGLVSVTEMACETKTTLTLAQCDKIRKENAQRAQAMKNRGRVKEGKREKGQGKEAGVQRGKGVVQWEQEAVKRDIQKNLKGGITALKEISKYQIKHRSTNKETHISESGIGDCPRDLN